MRTLHLCTALILLGCGQGAADSERPPRAPEVTPPAPAPAPGIEVPGFPGFFVPEGGMGGPPPHGGTDMVGYQYTMSRDALNTAMLATMAAHGWTVQSEEVSPRGSIRRVVVNGQTTIDLRIAGEGDAAAIIITRR
jgi:hypothetical protein